MANDTSNRTSFSAAKRWFAGLNVVASCLVFLTIVAMVNYVASRHFKRFQWTSDQRYQLSPMTTKLLDTLTNHVKVIVFFDPGSDMFSLVKGLINEYHLTCPNLDVKYVDYLREPGDAALLQTQYKFPSSSQDLVIFDCADCKSTPRIVYDKELADYDLSGVFTGQSARRTGFKGEQLFTSAIISVTDPKPFKAYYLEGHGEHNLTNPDEPTGYSKFARVLQDKKILMEPLSLLTNEVPADCQLVIIAGPRHSLAPVELERIEDYLNHGGRAFVLLANPQIEGAAKKTGLESTLASWNVEVGGKLVIDESQAKAGQTSVLYISDFGQHPIVRPLVGSRLGIVFPHVVRQQTGAARTPDTAKVTELAFTSERGREVGGTNGVIPLMVAVERGAIPGVSADGGSTRIVVTGDSYFLANANIDFDANRDFANLAVNWLLDRSQLMGIGPRPIREYRISLSQSQLASVRWILLAGLPGAVLLPGLLVWLRRRK